ncbi:helix-turn-helix transcriptional regulator [Pyxidicoccus sp. MSG2]|uniref:helix-turn-helix transcriptional regulator n=1 Tax=Pyxidicoccus sp. MSG2 TaxID=2996790 RepID=UPI002270072E|nr:LuxR C-terminal-related transcriptional regulator [Pyxidicoccus sp. MSG2]MCY1015888.1 LuxR C-terminal-related transcriptional regulator [Pyxidicoccus sp. MSG2]
MMAILSFASGPGETMPHRTLEHHELIGLIFDCAESETGLEPALAAIADQFGADKAHTLILRRGELVDSHFHGYDHNGFRDYERDWQDKDPRLATAVKSPGQIFSDVQIIEPSLFEASAIYNELLSKVGVRYTLFTTTEIAPDLHLGQALMRQKRAGAFEPEDIRRFTILVPHLLRAVRLRRLVAILRAERDDLNRALDAVAGPVALLDKSGKLICCNRAAEQLLTVGDGIRLERQIVTAMIPRESQQLAAALLRTAELAEGTSQRHPLKPSPTALQLTRHQGRPLGVVLMPLRPSSRFREYARQTAKVLAVFHDPDAVLRLDPELISQLHGLTATEALLASALAQGHSLAQFAASRGCSEQTARTHLKRALDKTDTRRQSDLVRVLLGSAALHLTRS